MKSLLGWIFCGLALWCRTDQKMATFNESKVSALRDILAGYCSGSSSLTCDTERTETSTESCCINCSCDRNCGLHGNCCYEEDDIYQLEKAGTLRCMIPATTDKKIAALHKNKFVVGPPVHGCAAAGSCSEELILWKTFYPVFSRSKKMNYISEACSHCHGVTDGIKWGSIISFLAKPSINILLDVVFNLTSMRAYLVFVHPGNQFENLQGICSDQVIDKCRSHSKLSDAEVRVDLGDEFAHYNIQTGDLIDQCLHGPNIPYPHKHQMYRNVFCLLCNRFTPTFNDCIRSDSKTMGNAFSTFIDFENLHEIVHNVDFSKKHGIVPMACKVNNSSSCRLVLCPTMQLRSENGECKFPSGRWQHPKPALSLKLTTSSSSHLGSLSYNLSESKLLDIFYEHSPWHKCWRLHQIGFRTYYLYVRNVTEFVLRIVCNVYETDPFKLMKSIQQSLSKEWILQTNEGILSLHQELYSTTLKLSMLKNRHEKKVFRPLWYSQFSSDHLHPDLKDTVLKLHAEAPYWEILMLKSFGTRQILFSVQKHFFCSQIQLREEEYDVLASPPLLIKYTPLQKILFHGELSGSETSEETSGEVQICLEDSDLEIVTNGADVHKFTIDTSDYNHVALILYFHLFA